MHNSISKGAITSVITAVGYILADSEGLASQLYSADTGISMAVIVGAVSFLGVVLSCEVHHD